MLRPTRITWLAFAAAVLVAGCSTNLKAVRGFADETKKLTLAFDPLLDGAVEQCRRKYLDRRVYTSDRPLSAFDADKLLADAQQVCQPIAQENASARAISKALADYAERLSELAGDGVSASLDDDYDGIAAKVTGLPDLPPEKVGAVTGLLKFLTHALVGKSQREAIAQALDHEEAVGVLGDALVAYTERVYAAYLKERLADAPLRQAALQAEAASPISSRLLLLDQQRQTAELQKLQEATKALRQSVDQMKATLHDLRANQDKLSDAQRLKEVQKLGKEVRALYRQLSKAF